jgi:anaerobic magnesium-protoporphyrin IX monomethyl ester cyclase
MNPSPAPVLVFPEIASPLPYPHLGIPALIAYLAERGHEDVVPVDLNSIDRSACGELLRASPFVGISIAYPEQLEPARSLAERIRASSPRGVIVAGGSTLTARIDTVVMDPRSLAFDVLVAGDGEEPLVEILDRVRGNSRDFSGIPNCYVRVGRSFVPPSSRFVMEPERYPTPRFPPIRHEALPVRMGKGCFWRKCTFCTYKAVFDGYLRPSIEVAIKQIEELRGRHGTGRFVLVDDAIPAKTLQGLADRLVERGIEVAWDCSAVFDKKFRDPSVAESLARGGCRTIYFGFESANPRVLGLMGKMNEPGTVFRILENLSRAGIHCHLNVMIGFPTETREEAQETIDFLRRNRRIFRNFHAQTFSLEEGSQIHRDPGRFKIVRLWGETDVRTGARSGFEFECSQGMTGAARRFMTMKCQLAYRKPGMSIPEYLWKRMRLYAFGGLHPRSVFLDR